MKLTILMLRTNHYGIFWRHFFFFRENESASEIMYDNIKHNGYICGFGASGSEK